MTVLTVNIWTGGPLLALWIGSRIESPGHPTMLAIAVVAVALGVISFCLIRLLARVDALYGRASGRSMAVRGHLPWLRSMRGERPRQQKRLSDLAPLDVILVTCVVVVVALFEIWFFFYSGSPIDQHSGRSHDAPLIG